MAENMGVITAVGRRKLCMALAGDASLPVIARMAWGNGGVDESGQPLGATGNEIGLYNELLVKDIESHVIIVLPFRNCVPTKNEPINMQF